MRTHDMPKHVTNYTAFEIVKEKFNRFLYDQECNLRNS
jgi:hypothetical protein